MMKSLSERQNGALAELINIAFGQTATSLSEITGQRVFLDAPQVAVHPIEELYEVLVRLLGDNIAAVHQIFRGTVEGDTFLVLDYEAAVYLVDLFTDDCTPLGWIDASTREVLTEVGNILLNACLGMFGELLQEHISFAAPRLRLEDLHTLLTSLVIGPNELGYALVAFTNFRLHGKTTRGYFVMVLDVTHLERLLQAVETWEKTQAGA